jgi:hypothetical protein
MTDTRREPAVTDTSLGNATAPKRIEGSRPRSREESQPLLAAFAVLVFWLFMSGASFNLPGLVFLSPILLLLFVFLLVKGLVRREVRRELARSSSV